MRSKETPAQLLGKAELGRYAYEERMPGWLYNQLQSRIGHKTTGLIAVLASLCYNDDAVEVAYLCHPAVNYISKTRLEGPYFCGYRNIQMLVSYFLRAKAEGWEHFQGELPTVLRLQDLIEDAWTAGISIPSRDETGGIKGTRKYIGTPEVQALFRSLQIPCRVGVYSSPSTESDSKAWTQLLDFAEHYFSSIDGRSESSKVYQTFLPPIYLQRPRHSLTIVGFTKRTKKDGSQARDLLVFDPAYRPSKYLRKVAFAFDDALGLDGLTSRRTKKLLRPFLRGSRELRHFKNFETLIFTTSVQATAHSIARTLNSEPMHVEDAHMRITKTELPTR